MWVSDHWKNCDGACPYQVEQSYCKNALHHDALALIQQLETDKQQLEGMLLHMNQLRDAAAGRALKMEERVHQLEVENKKLTYDLMAEHQVTNEQLDRIQQLEAERDAAVKCIPRACAYCKWYGTKNGGFFPDCKNPNGCRNISGINTGWEWRGAQKEE